MEVRRHQRRVTFNGRFNPQGLGGERITSTFRSPSRNAAVGGVSNSYHTRKGVDGKPLARDSVPPPGMSMDTYALRLKRLNPNYDVINEGDHVHMEPKG
jgi:Peptidase M15